MSRRYLLLVASGPRIDRERCAELTARTGLPLLFATRRTAFFADRDCPFLPIGEDGLVVGSLFPRHGPGRPLGALAAAESAAILRDPQATLLRSYWGAYVALVETDSGPWLGREPSGAQSCYTRAASCGRLFGSDTGLLLAAAGVRAAIAPAALARHLFGNGLPRAETALEGVEELLPGFQLSGRGGAPRMWWSPWDHAQTGAPPGGAVRAEQLGRTVRSAVHALTHGRGRLLLSLSGGLDSSIVAACLAEGGRDTIALTLYTDDPRGDERQHARAVAERLRLPLFEHRYALGEVDIASALSGHLPRPSGRTQAQVYERAHLALARAEGAGAFVTGNGGDNVFAYSQSAAAIADRLAVEGWGGGLLETLRDTCRQTGCGPLAAARHAARVRSRRGAPWRWGTDGTLLDRELVSTLGAEPFSHPWLDAAPAALAGQRAHVAGLLRVLPTLEPMRARVLPVISPLVAQPVMELCLAIPSWEWRAGGQDRAVARAAFAASLPPSILGRRTKGGPGGFTTEVIAAHRAAIGERLLGGRLAGWGLLDRAALADLLRDWRPTLGDEQVRIHELLEAEAWADHWAGGGGAASARSASHAASSSWRSGSAERRPSSQ